jgi:hypothetical protein
VRRSWDRGCNGHRILGRVLADGRHPGSSQGVGFHEAASRVVSAAAASSDPSSEIKSRARRPGCSVHEGGRGGGRSSGRDRGVRGSTVPAPWEENAHARSRRPKGSGFERSSRFMVRRSGLGCRETSGPPASVTEPKTPWGVPHRETGESELETREVRVHVVRMGGRYRSVASRAFSTVRSQDRVVVRGR